MARALAAAIVLSLLAVSGAGGAGAQTPKRGGTVVIGVPAISEPACLNPLLDCFFARLPPFVILNQVFAGPFEPSPGLTYLPRLVSSATYTKDPFSVTYHIRREATWSDGTPVTARDFVFTYQTILRVGNPGEDNPWRKIRRVVAVDAKTVKLVFGSRYSGWRELLLFGGVFAPRHALLGEDLTAVWRDRIDNPKTGRPIGSGPFLVDGWDRGKELTLIRNPRYWGPHTAYVERLVFRFVPDPVEALRQGEVDVVNVSLRSDAVPELRRDPSIAIRPVPGMAVEHLAIRSGSGGHPALRSKLVRRALAYGIDRDELARALFGDVAPALRPLDSAVILAQEPSYRPNWNVYNRQPDRARRLLEQSGCRRGADGIYTCAGERLSLRLFTTAGNARRLRTVELLQAQLRRIGVEVVPRFAPTPVLLGPDGIVSRGDFDVVLFQWVRQTAEPNEAARVYRCGGEQNFTGHCSRLLTRDLVQIDRILDPAQRFRVLNSADRKLARDVPVIPLFQPPYILAVRSTIKGVVPNPLADWLPYRAEDWWLER